MVLELLKLDKTIKDQKKSECIVIFHTTLEGFRVGYALTGVHLLGSLVLRKGFKNSLKTTFNRVNWFTLGGLGFTWGMTYYKMNKSPEKN